MNELDRELGRYTVPPLSDDFADRVVAKALASSPNVSPSAPRDRRGAWKRGRTILFGVGAFSLMSAAAAATGVFGDVAKDVPVIGTLIACVAPAKPKPVVVAAVKPKPKPVVNVAVAPGIAETPVAETILPVITSDMIDERRVARRARIEARVENQIAIRQERRAERGLPPLSERQTRRIKQMAMIPPEQRAAIKARVVQRIEEAGGKDAITNAERRAIIRDEMRSVRNERRLRRFEQMEPSSLSNGSLEVTP
jgi:hypothetical protein